MTPPTHPGPNLRLIPLSDNAADDVHRVLVASQDYFQDLGADHIPSDLGKRLLLEALHTPNRHMMSITLEGQIIGLMDFRLRYPSPETAYLGLLLLIPTMRRQGYGSLAMDIWETWLDRHTPILRVRLGVPAHCRRTLRFYFRRGYHLTGEARRVSVGHMQPRVLFLEKHLSLSTSSDTFPTTRSSPQMG